MSNKVLVIRRFSALRDYRSVQWAETLRYNLLRSLCAGITLAVIFLFVRISSPGPGPNPLVALLMPVGYLLAYLPVGLLLQKLGGLVGVFYLAAVVMAILSVSLGDPLVFLLRRIVPGLVPVEDPPFISTSLVIYVLKPELADQLAI